MTTTTSPFTLTAKTIRDFEMDYRDAEIACEAAWKTQSQTTVDDGYTYEQAEAASSQAIAAEQVKKSAYDRWQAAITSQAWLTKLAAYNPDRELLKEFAGEEKENEYPDPYEELKY